MHNFTLVNNAYDQYTSLARPRPSLLSAHNF
jgi:hypothetical protein